MMRPHKDAPAHHARLEAAIQAPSIYDLTLRLLNDAGLEIPASILKRDFTQPYEASEAVKLAWFEVYRDTARYWKLYELAEKLIDVEDNFRRWRFNHLTTAPRPSYIQIEAHNFRRWRFNHLTTVERIIGFKAGSGGTAGVPYLRRALEIVLFPELWQVRSEL